MVEQVFNSSLFRHKDSSLTRGLGSGKVIDARLAEGRGRPIWTVDDREARISPLDLQVENADSKRAKGVTAIYYYYHFVNRYNTLCFFSQGQESLNPNNLEFWVDDIYTPGYDALLRRKEANLRRLKICKLVALIATVVTIILIIVIPICTMGT